jgi:FAD:protein FMN transferase
MKRRRFLALSAASLLLPQALHASGVWRGVALGADAEIQLSGPQSQIDRAFAEIPALLDSIEAEFSLYRPNSALAQLNRTGRLTPSPRFARLCQICDQMHQQTQGVFDPTVQPLWQALASGGDLAAARRAIGWDRIHLGEEILLEKGQALTFNGIAQGYASDLLRSYLRDQGFALGQVNIGEYVAWGGPHIVGISDPLAGLLAQLRITDAALAVSSPNSTLIAGQPHILHPKGLPPLWSTVAVEADSAALADGLSTSLVFATKREIRTLKRQIGGLRRVYCVDMDGNLESS